MAAPSVANATTLTYTTSGAEQHVTSTEYYEIIVVFNASGQNLFVAVDGGTATNGGNHEMVIPNNQYLVFMNEQTLPQLNETGNTWGAQTVKYNSGAMDTLPTGLAVVPAFPGAATPQHNQSQASNLTPQSSYVQTTATPTYCSVIPAASTSGTVTVTFQ